MLATKAGAFLSTFLYNSAPNEGPTIKANVVLAVTLQEKKLS
jgi:hypothetical protein